MQSGGQGVEIADDLGKPDPNPKLWINTWHPKNGQKNLFITKAVVRRRVGNRGQLPFGIGGGCRRAGGRDGVAGARSVGCVGLGEAE